MNQFFTVIAQMCGQVNPLRTRLSQRWSDFFNKSQNGTSAALLKNVLEESFPNAKEIEVIDFSKGRGWVYTVVIETDDFQGLSVLQQHRAVYAALEKQMKVIHGIHITTKTPP